MISVLGLPLAEAEHMLREAGYAVISVETRSRKGVDGNEARVVRQKSLKSGEIELVYAVFKTDCTYGG
ncbi:MAG: hypothetical protein ABFC62_07375 [Clostridiaceae bacterium]|nr:hypothetical protein [Eubacteriales bacterium]